MRWQWRESVEAAGRIACSVRAGRFDSDGIAGPQRHGERIPLVEHVVAVAGRSRDGRVLERIGVAVRAQPVPDVLVFSFCETAVTADVEIYPPPAIGIGPNRHHLAVDGARGADDRTSRFDHELWWGAAEVACQRRHDGFGENV